MFSISYLLSGNPLPPFVSFFFCALAYLFLQVGNSPLHVAIYTKSLDAAAALHALGHLDCSVTNLKGDTPMALVEFKDHEPFRAIVCR